jgi:hypothetical protein
MEKIYMIPVNDAYSGTSECPFCALRNKAENDYLEYYLGPSLMEPDTRKITNKTGFCPEHMGKLNKSVTNRLGLGLVMHTHLLDFHEDISKDMINSAPAKAGLIKGRTSDYKSKLNDIADRIDKRVAMCPICEKLNDTMRHYSEVTAWMFCHNDDFRSKFSETKYHCLPHTAMLLRQAAKLSQNEAADFVSTLASTSDQAFAELIGDVEYFTLKFDYRNADKPWGNSKNAIQRSMRFLSADRRDFDEQLGKKQS